MDTINPFAVAIVSATVGVLVGFMAAKRHVGRRWVRRCDVCERLVLTRDQPPKPDLAG